MNSQDKLSSAQWVFERTLGWIAAAEVKVGVIVTIDLAMMAGLAALYADRNTPKDLPIHLASFCAAALAVLALFCAAMTLKPRLDGPKHSLLFFGLVAKFDQSAYVQAFKNASEDELLTDWLQQIHRNAVIADAKHGWVAKASLLSFASALAWILAVSQLVRG